MSVGEDRRAVAWWYKAVSWIIGGECVACAGPLAAEPSSLALCARCRGRVAPLSPHRCSVCCLPIPSGDVGAPPRCVRCRRRPPAFERLDAAFLYEDPVKAVIRGLKFRRLEFLGAHLAEAIHRKVGTNLTGCDLVVPVPLAWTRRLRRGFNQAELIARPLAKRLDLPVSTGALVRSVGSRPQSRSGRARRSANVEGIFSVRRGHELSGNHVLLVDDVATTMATLHHASVALRRAGAASVQAVVAARTPEPSRF